MANPGEGPGRPSYLRVWTTALPPPLPLSEGLDPPLAKFLFPVSNSLRIREKVAKSIVSLKAVGVSHVLFRKKGKLERYSLTLTLFLPAFCPLLTISLLSEEPLGKGGSRPSDKWGGRHPDSGAGPTGPLPWIRQYLWDRLSFLVKCQSVVSPEFSR